MPDRGPLLVLRAVETSAVAGGTLVVAVFSPLLCCHPYLLRSSVGLGLRLVNVEDLRCEEKCVLPKGLASKTVLSNIVGLAALGKTAESLLAQGCSNIPPAFKLLNLGAT